MPRPLRLSPLAVLLSLGLPLPTTAQSTFIPPAPVEITGPGIVGRVLRFADVQGRGLLARHVDVWLPPGYDADSATRYPVLYMHDGQNVFDPATSYGGREWGVDDVAARLIRAGRVEPFLVVAVWNSAQRWRDYMPAAPIAGQREIGTGIGGRVPVTEPWLADDYLRLLADDIKPFIDRTFRTRPEPAHTAVMGSSMGGLISLYAIARHPQTFGKAAAISTHWPAGDGVMVDWLARHLPDRATHRIWFDLGTATLDSLYPPHQARMDAAMRRAGWKRGTQWESRTYPGAEHNESSWRARVHEPLLFLFGVPDRLRKPDSALVRDILGAEVRRDATSPALRRAQAHPDARIRHLAARAAGRIADSLFATRTALPTDLAGASAPEPAWKSRWRALVPAPGRCATTAAALADSVVSVRLRALDVASEACRGDTAVLAAIRRELAAMPADVSRRERGRGSWHGAAHAVVALAKVAPSDAAPAVRRLADHPQWQVRQYAARAARILDDTATLGRLARDAHDNVAETALTLLAGREGHAYDALYLEALSRAGAPVVRAAAAALAGSSDPRVPGAALAAFDRWAARNLAWARDVRLALLAAAGKPASDDRAPPSGHAVAPRAVALALGAVVDLRVTMDAAAGGGHFTVRLRGDVAPLMAARVAALADAGAYDGTTWHRVEHDFVVQGLGPAANEYVGVTPAYFRDELGTVAHPRGSIGMSTRGHDTGDGQWFVNLRNNARLMRDYTVFAEIVDGLDVVDGILEGDAVATVRVIPSRP